MSDIKLALLADGPASHSVDRRTLLAGAAGTVAAAGLERACRRGACRVAAGRSLPALRPDLARRAPARAARRSARSGHDRSGRDPARTEPEARPLDRRRLASAAWRRMYRCAASIGSAPGASLKPFVSVVVLQLSERGRLSLDARLPEVLSASVTGRFPTAADITVRMLLGHRSGHPGVDLPAIDEQVARHPAKVWTVSEFLDLAAAQPPCSPPGPASSTPTRTTTCSG